MISMKLTGCLLFGGDYLQQRLNLLDKVLHGLFALI